MATSDFPEDEFIKQLEAIIDKNLENPDFSIEQLCREIGLSRTHLHRKIKAATQLSTSHFIRKIRLQRARKLLERSDYNISEIAYRTGNKSPQNFSKYFIREFGLSPSAYRRQFKQAEKESPVTERADDVAVDRSPQAPLPKSGNSTDRWQQKVFLYGVIGALLLVAGLFIFRTALFRSPSAGIAAGDASLPSIAVIPFENYGQEPDDFFCEGVVEDILTYLAQFKGLKVISRTSAAKYKNSDKTIRQIAAELRVSYILEGSVRQDSSEVRITAQLIRAADDKHIWARRFDRPKKNVMEIQAEVARAIASSLNQHISPGIQQKLERVPTGNLEAYNSLLRGRYLQRSRTKDDLYRSIEQFDAALQLDSCFSEAYAGKAAAYHLLTNLRYVPGQEEYYQDLAEQNALEAIRFDKSSGLAYGILGIIYTQQYRWEEAMSAFAIALDLSPNDAIINYWYGLSLRSTGDLDRALQYQKIASELDPLYPVIQAGYIYTCLLAGKFDLADQLIAQNEPVMGESFLYYTVVTNSRMRQGDYRGAVESAEKALRLNPEFKPTESDKIYSLGRLGREQQVLEYIVALDTTQALDCLRAAKAWKGLGDSDKSLQFLSRAAALGIINDDLLVEPIYADLRSHPAFLAILEQYGLSRFSSPLEKITVDRN